MTMRTVGYSVAFDRYFIYLSLFVLGSSGGGSLDLLGVENLDEENEEDQIGEIQPVHGNLRASTLFIENSLVQYSKKAHNELDELDRSNELSSQSSWDEMDLNQGIITIHDFLC